MMTEVGREQTKSSASSVEAKEQNHRPSLQHDHTLPPPQVSQDIQFLARGAKGPLFFLDVDIARRQLELFMELFPTTDIYYSTKTNPHPAILKAFADKGIGFDVATIEEIKLALKHGAQADKLHYTHPVKSVYEIKEAYRLGVRSLTLDSVEELKRQHEHATDAQHYIRVCPRSNASLYDYHQKFGATTEELIAIMEYAMVHNISIHGISFMVGSQSMSIKPWVDTFEYIHAIIDGYYDKMPSLRNINMGSGFPIEYTYTGVPKIKEIARVANRFADSMPEDIRLIAEPGRFITAPSTLLATHVIQSVPRLNEQWLYTDANAYSGLIEIIENSGHFPYRISSNATGPLRPYMIAGKTLDPDDILGRNVLLSKDILAGDLIYVHDTGAYSSTFFTNYHSLPHPKIVILDSEFADNVTLGKSGMSISGLKSKKHIKMGEIVFRVTGAPSRRRSRTSFQTGKDTHVEPNIFGAYLNHSCEPSVGIRTSNEAEGVLEVVAMHDIEKDEDIAADYAMFEYQTSSMAKVKCRCGSTLCRTYITGYKDLPKETKKRYKGYIADHLLE
jgi:ornithine decarboxylase